MLTASGATVEDTPAVRTGRTRSATKANSDLRVVMTSPSLKSSSLPIEILHHIVGYLAESDKPSLAACMSASPALNKLVGPKLYRNISWTGENQDSYPFHIPVASFKRRITLPKRTLLKNINSATVEWHTPDSGCSSSPIFNKPLPFSTLIARSGKCGNDSSLACRLCCYFAPTKLVAKDNVKLSLRHSFRINRSSLSKVVIIWNLEHSIAEVPLDIFRASKCTNRQLIVIVRTQESDTYEGQAIRGEAVYKMCRFFWKLKQPHYVNDFVFVNMDASKARDALNDVWTIILAESGGLEGFTLKVISLEEYMRDFDWEGEFTEEEARSWVTVA